MKCETIQLSPGLVAAYKELLTNPKKNGFDFRPITEYNCACGYGYELSKADNGTHITSSVYEGTNDGGEWDTYEEVLETGLQEALKLI